MAGPVDDDTRQQLTEAAARAISDAVAVESDPTYVPEDDDWTTLLSDSERDFYRVLAVKYVVPLLAAATTEGRRQAAEAVEALYDASGPTNPLCTEDAYFLGIDRAVAAARDGSAGQEHPQP